MSQAWAKKLSSLVVDFHDPPESLPEQRSADMWDELWKGINMGVEAPTQTDFLQLLVQCISRHSKPAVSPGGLSDFEHFEQITMPTFVEGFKVALRAAVRQAGRDIVDDVDFSLARVYFKIQAEDIHAIQIPMASCIYFFSHQSNHELPADSCICTFCL